MKRLSQKVEEFKKLSKEQQFGKVYAMLEILKEWDDFFWDFFEMLSNLWKEVDDELLITIYSMIQSAILALEDKDNQKNIQKLSKTKEKLEKIKELEKQQKQEENPDDLLKLID